MKIRYIKANKWLIGMMLTLLGFSGCDDNKDEWNGEGPLMYGTPMARFVIKAKVVNNNQEAVEGISVITSIPSNTPSPHPIDTVSTNNEGISNIDIILSPFTKLIIEAQDVDGEQNGNYKNTIDTLKFTQEDIRDGVHSKEITIVLQEKTDE